MNAFDYQDEFEGLSPNELTELQYLWANFIDFAYSPYTTDTNELHYYMHRIGKILGDVPPEAYPFCGTATVGE